MTTPNRQALIQYRLEQAEGARESAGLLLEKRLTRDSVNRSYYAMYYATLALLASEGRSVSKHSGLLMFFDMDFVKSGPRCSKFPKTAPKSCWINPRNSSPQYGNTFHLELRSMKADGSAVPKLPQFQLTACRPRKIIKARGAAFMKSKTVMEELLRQIEQLDFSERQELRRRLGPAMFDRTDPAKLQELDRCLLDKGLLSQINPVDATLAQPDPWQPISVPGEPISETLIQDRR
jgi:uncharacterized protein (UPF0332 family)